MEKKLKFSLNIIMYIFYLIWLILSISDILLKTKYKFISKIFFLLGTIVWLILGFSQLSNDYKDL